MSTVNGSEDKTPFEWKPEHETLLNVVVQTGVVESWSILLEVIKYKIVKNVEHYLEHGPTILPTKGLIASTPDGLVILPPETSDAPNLLPLGNQNRKVLASNLNENEAKEQTNAILALLDEFTDGPPFTIKRVCELALSPRSHYNFLGKYLRGLERVLLVTSPPETFELDDVDDDAAIYKDLGMKGAFNRRPTTPIFSPIPFLHHDARRSLSPMSPFMLANSLSSSDAPADEPVGFGLVDELDTPAKGHMATKPNPLTATTTLLESPPKSLSERFVKSREQEEQDKEKEAVRKSEDAEVENMVLAPDEGSSSEP